VFKIAVNDTNVLKKAKPAFRALNNITEIVPGTQKTESERKMPAFDI